MPEKKEKNTELGADTNAVQEKTETSEDKLTLLEKEVERLKKELEQSNQGQTIVKRAEDTLITVFFMGQNGEGLCDKITYGSGKSKTFRNFRDRATLSLTEFEQEFAQSAQAISFFKRGLLVLGADTPKSVLDSFELSVETDQYLTKKQYRELLNRGVDQLLQTYHDVCQSQKDLILETVVTAVESNDPRLTREMLEKLNEATKADGKAGGKLKTCLMRYDERQAEHY